MIDAEYSFSGETIIFDDFFSHFFSMDDELISNLSEIGIYPNCHLMKESFSFSRMRKRVMLNNKNFCTNYFPDEWIEKVPRMIIHYLDNIGPKSPYFSKEPYMGKNIDAINDK